jgi:hypothetical protein
LRANVACTPFGSTRFPRPQRLQEQRYESSDRKYHSARAMANRDLKADYVQRVSRQRPKP